MAIIWRRQYGILAPSLWISSSSLPLYCQSCHTSMASSFDEGYLWCWSVIFWCDGIFRSGGMRRLTQRHHQPVCNLMSSSAQMRQPMMPRPDKRCHAAILSSWHWPSYFPSPKCLISMNSLFGISGKRHSSWSKAVWCRWPAWRLGTGASAKWGWRKYLAAWKYSYSALPSISMKPYMISMSPK